MANINIDEINAQKNEFAKRVARVLEANGEEFGMVWCLIVKQAGQKVPMSVLTNCKNDGVLQLLTEAKDEFQKATIVTEPLDRS
jgi:hypothetical protein